MQTSYQAYGLRLLCGFPLPGMTPHPAEGLSPVELDLTTPEELSRLWSGSPEGPTWRGTLGDGVGLTIEHGVGGDVLFTYGDRARFRLDAEIRALECAPSQATPDWQRALIGKVLPTVSLIRGYEALHAGVVDTPAGLIAIAGPSGAGKSTLSIELLRRGWPLFADDALTLEDHEGAVRAHPGTPHMNLAMNLPDAIDPQTIGETLHILAGERWLAAHASVTRPRPVRMVCLLERGPGLTLESRTLSANPLLLAPYMLSLSSEADRQRSRFCLYANLMESAALVRLTAGVGHRPAEIADELERALASTPEPLAQGIA